MVEFAVEEKCRAQCETAFSEGLSEPILEEEEILEIVRGEQEQTTKDFSLGLSVENSSKHGEEPEEKLQEENREADGDSEVIAVEVEVL